jgi:hypothetical protein
MQPVIDPFGMPDVAMLEQLLLVDQCQVHTAFPLADIIFALEILDRKTQLMICPIFGVKLRFFPNTQGNIRYYPAISSMDGFGL